MADDSNIKTKIKDIIELIKQKPKKDREHIKKFIEQELVKVLLDESGINGSKHIETALRYSIHEIIDVITNAVIMGEVNSKRLAVKALLKISAVLAKALCEVGSKCIRNRSRRNLTNNNGVNAVGVIPGNMPENNFSRSSATRKSSARRKH